MAKIKSRTPFSESNGRLIVGWAILIALVIGAVAFAQRQYLIAELQTEAASLYRLASQRADQHDAHMTALSAPAVAGADERPDLFLEVATTILRFYARIAIVARSGVTSVVLRADNAGPHTVGSSAGKAFASASLGRDTAGLAEFIAGNAQNDGLRDMDARMVIQAGGLPIKIGGALVGGVGVGGAPSGDVDTACARKGLDAIGAE